MASILDILPDRSKNQWSQAAQPSYQPSPTAPPSYTPQKTKGISFLDPLTQRTLREQLRAKGFSEEDIDKALNRRMQTEQSIEALRGGLNIEQFPQGERSKLFYEATKQGVDVLTAEDKTIRAEERKAKAALEVEERKKGAALEETKKPIRGLMKILDELKVGAEDVGVADVAMGKLGLTSGAQRFNQKKKLATDFLIKMVADKRITNEERTFYQNEIMKISPLGRQEPKEEVIDDLKKTITSLAGFDPEEFGIRGVEEELPEIEEGKPSTLPNIPEAIGGVVSKVADFFYPQTTKLLRQIKGGEQGELPDITQRIAEGVSPVATVFRDDQVGEAAKEITGAAIIDFATVGALKAAKPLLSKIFGKVTGPMANVIKSFARSRPEVQVFLQAFTIPTKVADKIKPIKVAKEIVDYGVSGGFDDMNRIVDTVTGSSGIVSKATRELLSEVGEEIPLRPNLIQIAEDALGRSFLIKDETARNLIGRLTSSIKTGKQLGKTDVFDAFDLMRELEQQAAQAWNSSTYLTKRPDMEQLGKILYSLSDEVEDLITKTAAKSGAFDKIKTPERIQILRDISPKLAKKFYEARDVGELRNVAAVFVKLRRMIDLTEAARQSSFQNLARSARRVGAGIGAAGLGGAVAGIPGIIAGFITSELAEKAISSPRLATGAAKAISKGVSGVAKRGMPTIPPAVSRGVKTGTRVMMQALKSRLSR